MAPRSRRPLVSLEAQLQQLTLFSDLDAEGENLEQLGPIIKSLDEARQQDAFLRHLKNFVRKKDDEIETVCNANHQDFVSAVDKLLRVRSGTVSLKQRIGELNEDVQAGGQSLGNKKKQLLETRRVGQNVDEAIETIQACLRVLDMAYRIDSLIQSKKYYSALRSLEELETIHLKAVLHHEFAKHMMESIPQMRAQVRQAVTREMKEWLYEVREKSRTIGRLALDAMEARQKRWRVKSQRDPMLSLAKVNSAIELVVNERVEYNFVDNEHVKIDFKPLYQCIHIYDVMDMREQLQSNYQEDRREVVGFFIVEHHVLQTSPSGFRADQEVDDLWDNMCERVVDIVSVGLRDCKDTKVYVSTKAAVQTFIQTLEGYSFTVAKLNALLLTLFERYAQLLRDRFSADFQQAMRETEHQPMVVNNADELMKVLNVCWLKPGDADSLRTQGYPLSLPFSQTYPLCCMDIRNLVDQYYTFSDGFSQHHRDIDDILKRSLDELLIQQVSNGIRTSLEKTKNLSQIAQIVVNAEHFKLACTELEGLLAALRAPHRGGKLRLDASGHFAKTLEVAQQRIDEALAAKLDQFVGLAEYDWTPARPRDGGGPAAYLQDMLDWLTTMMDSVLILLPRKVKEEAYRAAFKHLARQLLDEQLLSKDEDRCNANALVNLQTDAEFLRRRAMGLGEGEGGMEAFEELRQTLAVVLTDSVNEFAHNSTARMVRFPRAQPAKVAAILERIARFHSSKGPAEAEMATKRSREKDAVLRLVRR
ncbi:Rab GTPase-binding exocyst subunit S15 [Thecaphora frezii]